MSMRLCVEHRRMHIERTSKAVIIEQISENYWFLDAANEKIFEAYERRGKNEFKKKTKICQ